MNDVNVFVSHALSDVAIRDFIYSYSATNTAIYEAVVTMVFQCPEQSRAEMKQAVTILLEKLVETDDLHVLSETIHFSDEYTGERTYVPATEQLIARLDAKMMG
jgi:hypothetical protein